MSSKQSKVKQTQFKAKVIAKVIYFDWPDKLTKPGIEFVVIVYLDEVTETFMGA